MKIFVGVTDDNWFNYLASIKPDEVNFWQPSGRQSFKALKENELFLFKLHSPLNYIVGGGFFVRHAFLPISLAWEAFGNKNGMEDYYTFSQAIYGYRGDNPRIEPDPTIGCIILTAPFFFERSEWIPMPVDFKLNIVKGKGYDTETDIGRELYHQVIERMNVNRYGAEQIIRPRLGQGAFRVVVTEAYNRRCAISGEKTLPVLEAAHIKPYSQEGPHETNNGLLLRKDIHTLFDRGYITVDDKYRIHISNRIKEDYGNGKIYYALHGNKLVEMPVGEVDRPSVDYLKWHNENIYIT